MERRRSRNHFTRVLSRICEQLTTTSVAEVSWTDTLFRKSRRSAVSIQALWVVGSYARGALDCGDLDLVMEATAIPVDGRADLPPTTAICRTFFRSPADVRVYLGTPKKNRSGVEFEEAKPIWSREDTDWRLAIEAIHPDPSATRFVRPSDSIPLRQEQIVADLDRIDELLELERSKTVQWHFVPCSDVKAVEATSEDESDLLELATYFCGKKTQQLLPHLLLMFRSEFVWPKGRWERQAIDKTAFRHGGCDILVGKPWIPIEGLDELRTSRIALFPHLTQRGPNGVWFLTRGDEHPLIRKANSVRLFCHVDEDGQPIDIHCIDQHRRECIMVDLFSRESDAAEQAREDEQEFETTINVRAVSGRGLLALLAVVDVVDIEDECIPLTDNGQRFLETDTPLDSMFVLEKLGNLMHT